MHWAPEVRNKRKEGKLGGQGPEKRICFQHRLQEAAPPSDGFVGSIKGQGQKGTPHQPWVLLTGVCVQEAYPCCFRNAHNKGEPAEWLLTPDLSGCHDWWNLGAKTELLWRCPRAISGGSLECKSFSPTSLSARTLCWISGRERNSELHNVPWP